MPFPFFLPGSQRRLEKPGSKPGVELLEDRIVPTTIAQITDDSEALSLRANPSINDNGTIIVFDSEGDHALGNDEGRTELFLADVADLANPAFEQITDDDGSTGNHIPSINGSGQFTAFQSNGNPDPDGGGAPQGNLEGNSEIFLFNSLSSETIQITDDPVAISTNPAINDSGTFIAFSSTGDFDPGSDNSDGSTEIFLANVADPNNPVFAQLTNANTFGAFNPTISGNGGLIAFQSRDELLGAGTNPESNTEIFFIDLSNPASPTTTQITSTANGNSINPILSDDGSTVSFESTSTDIPGADNPEGNSEIFLFDPASQDFIQITTTGVDVTNARASLNSDGSRGAFQSDQNGSNDIFFFDIELGTTIQITDSPQQSTDPVLDDSGLRGAFVSNGDFVGLNADNSPELFVFEIAPAALTATKVDAIVVDTNADGAASPGETLRYTVTIRHRGDIPAFNVVFDDAPDANTTLVPGSVTTTQGVVTTGLAAGDQTVRVDIGNIVSNGTVTITFDATVRAAFPDQVDRVANQGTVRSDNTADVLTDDPDVAGPADPTLTDVIPLVSIVSNANTIDEAGGTAVLTTSLSHRSNQDIVLSFAFGGNANIAFPGQPAVADYTSNATPPFVIPAGRLVQTFRITALNDALREGDETISVGIATATNAAIIPGQRPTITITDDETPAAVASNAQDVGGGEVRVFNADGTLRFTVTPYGDFLGSIRTATADVNGDGTEDIITGPGPGFISIVRVFDGITGNPLAGFPDNILAYPGNYANGIVVAGGDVSGDGIADLITVNAVGPLTVRSFNGINGAPIRAFDARNANGATLIGSNNINVFTRDQNGDGRDDIFIELGGQEFVFDAFTGNSL